MVPRDMMRLDAGALAQRIEELGLKQWWIARELGVDRKTVGRWANGKVKRLETDRGRRLAELLSCQVEDLTLCASELALATTDEKRAAVAALREGNLLERLRPTDDAVLAEPVIRAAMQKQVPLRDLGRLYNLLASADRHQGRLEEGVAHAERAFAVGERTDDAAIMHKAVLNLAGIDADAGRPLSALQRLEACLETAESFETEYDHASALLQAAEVYRDFGRLEEALRTARKAARIFEELAARYNLAQASLLLSRTLTEAGRWDEAQDALKGARDHAGLAGDRLLLECWPLYLGDPLSLRGDHERAARLVAEALPRLETYDRYDLGLHEIAARVFRRAHRFEDAREQVERGLDRALEQPQAYALLLLEQARLSRTEGAAAKEEASLEDANRIFAELGMTERVAKLPVPEFGTAAA